MHLAPCPVDDWPALPCALQQHPLYGQTVRRMGGQARLFRVVSDGADAGRVQVLFRRFGPLRVAWIGRGPVWSADPPAELADIARALPGVALIQPDSAAEAEGLPAATLMTAPHMAELDLTGPAAARRARQHGKWRNRLCRAEAAGLRVCHRPYAPATDAALLNREAVQRRTRRYAALPHAFLRHWAGQARKATRLFIARDGRDTVAFMLFLLHAPVATYHIGWSGALGRQSSAHHLLLWQASEWLAQQGFSRLDLGSVETDTTPGIARFKIGSGAHIRAIGPTLLPLPRFLRPPPAVLRAFPLAFRRNGS